MSPSHPPFSLFLLLPPLCRVGGRLSAVTLATSGDLAISADTAAGEEEKKIFLNHLYSGNTKTTTTTWKEETE